MAAPSGSAPLERLETAIIRTIETINSLSEFTEPSTQPDNAGLALNLCAPRVHVQTRQRTLLARGAPVELAHACAPAPLLCRDFLPATSS